jgi:hypothetical protein
VWVGEDAVDGQVGGEFRIGEYLLRHAVTGDIDCSILDHQPFIGDIVRRVSWRAFAHDDVEVDIPVGRKRRVVWQRQDAAH